MKQQLSSVSNKVLMEWDEKNNIVAMLQITDSGFLYINSAELLGTFVWVDCLKRFLLLLFFFHCEAVGINLWLL